MDDRYKINNLTAELPFGNQYEATDTLISRQAQIHRFAVPGENAPSDWTELFNEASGDLTTLSHVGLPIIYDKGVNDGEAYLIRQLVEEPTLESRLHQGPLSEYEGWELAQQLLDIHSIALSKGYFHGALTLDRICYATRPGGEKRYYITGFGLPELHNLINGTQEYFGLPCLISLEQAAGEAPSESSEIFSIGQLLYLCLSENHPFASNEVGEMQELHQSYPLTPLSESRSDIPEAMVNWMQKMTATDPSERFETYAEAMEALPSPQQTVAIPIIATTTSQQYVGVAGQTTGVQQVAVPQTGTQAVSFDTSTQPVASKQTGGALKILKQEPMIVGAAVLALILIIAGFVVFSGDDQESDSSKGEAVSSERSSRSGGESSTASESDTLNEGLVVALNFDGSLSADNDRGVKVEVLKGSTIFGEGISKQALVLDENHYYRLSLDGLIPDGDSASFTVSLWMKSKGGYDPAFVSDEPWSDGSARKLAGENGKEHWQWSPENYRGTAKQNAKDDWSMLTMVVSRKKNLVTVYSNGDKIGSSSTEAVDALDSQKYLYIGCDSHKKFSFSAPTLIDRLYIWDRKLSSKEVRSIYTDMFTY